LPDTPISSKDVVNKPPYSKEAGVLFFAEKMWLLVESELLKTCSDLLLVFDV